MLTFRSSSIWKSRKGWCCELRIAASESLRQSSKAFSSASIGSPVVPCLKYGEQAWGFFWCERLPSAMAGGSQQKAREREKVRPSFSSCPGELLEPRPHRGG